MRRGEGEKGRRGITNIQFPIPNTNFNIENE
jgi:hypothetical protein